MDLKESGKWKEMQNYGKVYYVLRHGVLYYGLPTGIGTTLITLLIDVIKGKKLIDLADSIYYEFLYRALLFIILWSIQGCLKELIKWKKYEKKYSNKN